MKPVHHSCARSFGWFGTDAHIPNNWLLNYLSVALAVVRVFLFAFVRPAEDSAAEPVRARALCLQAHLEVT